ncbi:MAG TPA: hypothetical protein PKV21_03050 [bacterium]|nr:hypothetical protein [bacterium]HOM26468.1 hypothetical protein [bacterium]
MNYGKLIIENINGKFNKDLEGDIKFSFYKGKGNIDIKNKDFSYINGKLFIENLNLKKLAYSFNEKIVFEGLMNINGEFNIGKGKFEIDVTFNSVKKRGIKQFMNFGAIELIASLSGGNPIRMAGSSNFYYKDIKGRISIKDNRFTIEGLLGEKNGNQYLITKPFLLPGINILINKKSNTIEIHELINRVNLAIERIREKD